MVSINLGAGAWKEKSDYFALQCPRVCRILAKAKDKTSTADLAGSATQSASLLEPPDDPTMDP